MDSRPPHRKSLLHRHGGHDRRRDFYRIRFTNGDEEFET
jgi:hypothetical protein